MKLQELFVQIDHFPLVEMANLRSDETGLVHVIWIGRIGGQHGPRIKVSNVKGKWRENDNFVLSVDEKEPQLKSNKDDVKIDKFDLEQIKKWIVLNYDDLMLLWYMFERNVSQAKDEDTELIFTMDDVFDRLKKV